MVTHCVPVAGQAMPGGHGVQTLLPGKAYSPAVHAISMSTVAEGHAKPALQLAQTLLMRSGYVPAVQRLQPSFAGLTIWLALQVWHVLAPEELYLPGPHAAHDAAPAAALVPAVHVTQLPMLVCRALGEAVPALHGVGIVSPPVQKKPGEQVTHEDVQLEKK